MTGITQCRGFLIKLAGVLIVLALGIAPNSASHGQAPFFDDFNDGNDAGWTHYDVLQPFGFPGQFTFPNGNSYSIESPQNYSVLQIQRGRVGAIVNTPSYSDFRITHDIIDWHDGREYVFGPIARAAQPGLGTTDGYLLLLHATDHDFALYRVENEDPGDAIGGVEEIEMPADRDFRVVFTGQGTQLSGLVYDRANLQTPLGGFTTDVAGANPYTNGQVGLIVAQADDPDDTPPPPGPPYAATFDNYRVTVPTVGEWNALGSGKVSDVTPELYNWVGNVAPTGVGAHAKFLGAAEVDAVVDISSAFFTLGRITFDNSHAYKLTGEQITLQNNGDAELNVISGSHEIANPLTLQSNVKFTGPGTLTISTPLDWTGKSVEVASGNLRLADIRQGDLRVTGGAATLVPSGGTSVLNNLAIPGGATPAGKLDITNNAAIIDYNGASPVDSVREQIIAGRGGPGLNKPWNGNGITSSQVQADVVTSPNAFSVGYAENSALPLQVYTNFRGEPVDSTAVLLAYTRTADANLDGVVNNNDVAVVGANYAPNSPKPFWALGDFDYSGFVDNDDITLLGAFYNPDAPPLAVPISGLAAVPEPGALLLAIAGMALLPIGRRWQRKRS
jgi:hypothetical protein